MKIPVVCQESGNQLPVIAHIGDAGADLIAAEDLTVEPGERALVRTGISMSIPEGFCGLVLPRSGLAVRNGVTVLNAPGLIDSGYRGEIRVVIINHGDEVFEVLVGDRIAQLVIIEVASPEFIEVESLQGSERGSGGFGSTGVRAD